MYRPAPDCTAGAGCNTALILTSYCCPRQPYHLLQCAAPSHPCGSPFIIPARHATVVRGNQRAAVHACHRSGKDAQAASPAFIVAPAAFHLLRRASVRASRQPRSGSSLHRVAPSASLQPSGNPPASPSRAAELYRYRHCPFLLQLLRRAAVVCLLVQPRRFDAHQLRERFPGPYTAQVRLCAVWMVVAFRVLPAVPCHFRLPAPYTLQDCAPASISRFHPPGGPAGRGPHVVPPPAFLRAVQVILMYQTVLAVVFVPVRPLVVHPG